MPYQPAVTPDTSKLYDGLSSLGEGFGQRNENIRKEREKNEGADVTLEHLHSVSPELLEPFLRRGGDMETPSAELLSSFLGKSTRAKKEALIGAVASQALMDQRKQQTAMERQRLGYEGQRIQQNDRQFNESMRADKTKLALQTNQHAADQKERRKMAITQMPDGERIYSMNGQMQVKSPAAPRIGPITPEALKVQQENARLGVKQVWNGERLAFPPVAPQTYGPDGKGNWVPLNTTPTTDVPPLPPLPAAAQTPIIKIHPQTGVRYQFMGGDATSAAAWRAIQ